MNGSDEGHKDYEVGYGKPPKHSQWKPGQSGNPSGKMSKEESFLDKVRKVASEELIVHKGGQALAMSNIEAAIHAIFAKAQGGHPQAFKLLADIIGKDEATEAIAASSYVMTDADLSVLKTAADWQALVETAQSGTAPENPAGQDEGGMDDDPSSDAY